MKTLAQQAVESYLISTASARRLHERAVRSVDNGMPLSAVVFQKLSAESYARAEVAREMFAIHRRDK